MDSVDCPFQKIDEALKEVKEETNIIFVDIHARAIQGFFNIPVDHLFAAPVTISHIRSVFKDDLVIVSPDAGGAEPQETGP